MKKLQILLLSIVSISIAVMLLLPLHTTIEDLTSPQYIDNNINFFTESNILPPNTTTDPTISSTFFIRWTDADYSEELSYLLNNLTDFTIEIPSNLLQWQDENWDTTPSGVTSLQPAFFISLMVDGTPVYITLFNLDSYIVEDLSTFNLTYLQNGFAISGDIISNYFIDNSIDIADITSFAINFSTYNNTSDFTAIYYDEYPIYYTTIEETEAILNDTSATILQIIPFIIIAGIVVSAVLLIKRED